MAEEAAQKPAEAPKASPSGGGKSSAPFTLSIIGGILILLNGITLALFGSLVGGIGGMVPGGEALMAIGAMMYIPLVLGIVIIIGTIMMRNPEKAKIGSILVLILSIISLVTVIGSGFIIGAILGIIGGALGLKNS